MATAPNHASGLHERLYEIAGDRTYRALADITGLNSETVRRYMQGQSPSVEFLASICAAMGVSANWLLMGQGPMRAPDARRLAEAHANPAEILSALAEGLETVTARLDRLDSLVRSLESRVRAEGAGLSTANGGTDERRHERDPRPAGPAARAPGAPGRIAGAIAQRPPPTAR